MNSKLNSTLYFPDISKFTNFVNNTEIEHGQQITASLLEEIINSNYVDFIVSEIEGDSVLFFKAESKEEVNKLIELSLHIHKKYHQRRNQLNKSANCSCGACSSIVNLKLKFIIHIGEVKKIKIHTYEKLYGRDVIIAHRLLKIISLMMNIFYLRTLPLIIIQILQRTLNLEREKSLFRI